MCSLTSITFHYKSHITSNFNVKALMRMKMKGLYHISCNLSYWNPSLYCFFLLWISISLGDFHLISSLLSVSLPFQLLLTIFLLCFLFAFLSSLVCLTFWAFLPFWALSSTTCPITHVVTGKLIYNSLFPKVLSAWFTHLRKGAITQRYPLLEVQLKVVDGCLYNPPSFELWQTQSQVGLR